MANYIKGTKIQENSISETKLDSSLQSWKETVTNHINNNDNPHNITKSSIGLDNVTNDAQVKRSELGVANGVATLDSTGKVPSGQLPSYVDDVIEGYLYNGVFYKDTSYTTSIVGESGKIYIDLPTNKTYRWTGSVYGVISETIALGELSSTAYRGDRGKIAYDHSQSAHAPSNAQANVIETIKVNGTALTPNSKAVDITVPTVGNGTITIKQGGTSKGTFTTNQNGNTTIELTDTNTTYTAGDGLSLSGTTFSNNGVRSIATGTTNGTISVNTNGNISNIGVYGLKSAAYTNSSDYAAASHTHTFDSLTSKPTTISGYGITDAMKAFYNSASYSTDLNSLRTNGSFYISRGASNSPKDYCEMLCMYNVDTIAQLAISHTTEGSMYYRGGDTSRGYYDWRTVLDSGNYNTYCPTLTGTGASGTWGINISGNATTASYAASLLPISKPTTNTSASNKPFSYFVGQPTIGTAEGNAYAGSSNDYNLLSFPTEGTYYTSTVANIMTLRLSWDKSKYWHDIFASPNKQFLWHRQVYNGTAMDWYRIVEEDNNTAWGINISGNAATATNADTLDGYHASNVFRAPSFNVHNPDTSNTYVLIATITISGTSTGFAEFTTLFQNREVLDSSSFILSCAIRRNSTSNVNATLSYTTLHTSTPRNIYLRSDDGVTFRVYIQSVANSYTTFYRAVPLLDSGNITYSNTGTTSPISGTVVNITATKGGNVASATKLANSRTIWGQSFDGTGNVSGNLTDVGSITPTTDNSHDIGTSSNQFRWVYAHGLFAKAGSELSLGANDTDHMRIITNGNVGIGTSSPSYKLHVVGDGYFTENVITESNFSSRGNAIIDGYVGIGTSSPAYNLDVDGNMRITGPIRLNVPNSNEKYYISTEYNGLLGITYEGRYQNPAFLMNDLGYVYLNCERPLSPAYPLVVNGTVSCTQLLQTSDIKYKTNIKQIEYEEALKIIENLNPVTWDWNENTKISGSSSGFVAQEAEEFIPNAISRDNENNLSLDYTQLHSYEIKVIQEQQKEIKDLKQRLEVLENLVLQLTNREI